MSRASLVPANLAEFLSTIAAAQEAGPIARVFREQSRTRAMSKGNGRTQMRAGITSAVESPAVAEGGSFTTPDELLIETTGRMDILTVFNYRSRHEFRLARQDNLGETF